MPRNLNEIVRLWIRLQVANWQTKREEFALVEPGEFFYFCFAIGLVNHQFSNVLKHDLDQKKIQETILHNCVIL